MTNDLFAYYFDKIEYHIQLGKGISVFNSNSDLFSNFLAQAETSNHRLGIFKSSNYLKQDNLYSIDDAIDLVLIYQDVDIPDLQKIIEPFVNKLVYSAFYKNKPICFFSNNDADDYVEDIKSGLIHTDLRKVVNLLLVEQLVKLLDQVNYKFSSPEFLKTNYDKTIYTPIEHEMKDALEKENIPYRPQVKLGRFYVDFLIELENEKIIVECDGREYHNPYRDRERDKELGKEGYRILHFTGSEIYNGIDSCIQKIRTVNSQQRRQKFQIDSDLDESQRKALEFITGPIRVLAPAGSGKTKTLINRIAYLLNKGVDSNSILALAFNKKAAEEMRQRLSDKQIPVSNRLEEEGVAVRTFHSFGYEIIRNELNWSFDEKNSKKDTRKFLEKAIERHHHIVYERNRDSLDSYLEALRKTKMEIPHIDEVAIEQDKEYVPFKDIFYSFLDYQKEHNFINFDDMIYMALRLLIDNRVLRDGLQNRFRYVLVDEFQDLNRAQLLMVQIIALPQNNIFIVGDDDQMIYGWRGAEVKHLLEFNKRYAVTQDCTLLTNYRSSKKIVNHSKWLISYNTERIPKDINPKLEAKTGSINIELTETLWDRAKTTINWIKELKSSQKLKWSDFAVLFRYHAFQFVVAMALDSENIPHSPVNGQRLFSSEVGRDLYSYMTIILRTDDAKKEDYSRILNRPNKYFRNDIINKVFDWDSFVRTASQQGLRNWEQEKLQNFIETIKLLKDNIKNSSPSSFFDKLDTEIKLVDFYKDQTKRFADLDEATNDIIFEVIISLSRNLKTLDEFYEYMHKCHFDDDGSIDDYDEDRYRDEVKLSTIHSAKGKEFNNVVYFNLSENDRLREVGDIEEERRVSYVGVTRSIDNILITAPKRRHSRFLEEVAFNIKLREYSINKLYSILNKKRRKKAKIEYEIKNCNKKKESILTKFPELEGKNLVESYSFFNSIWKWLREKRIEKAAERIDNLDSRIADLKDNYLLPISDSINEIETEISFRSTLSNK